MDKLKKYFAGTLIAGLLFFGSGQVSFGQISFQNGQFTSFSQTASTDTGIGGGVTDVGSTTYSGDTLTGWSNNSYTFVYRSPNVGDESETGQYSGFSLWGAANGSDPGNGGANILTLPPGGGNFIADDGAFEVGPLTQVITGLTNGASYNVSFEWAGAQQSGFNGATTESWSVALGNATGVYTQGSGDTSGTLAGAQTTTTVNNVTHGFTGWMSQTFTVTANSSTDTLYFFANGTPTGQPPFALLADVNVAVPEPKTYAFWTLLFGMAVLFGNRVWRRWQKIASSKS